MSPFLTLFLLPLLVAILNLIIEYWVIQPLRKANENKSSPAKKREILANSEASTTQRFGRAIAWLLIGKADEKALGSVAFEVTGLILSVVRWTVMGAMAGLAFLGLLMAIASIGGTNSTKIDETARQYATLGAIIGVISRLFVWPLITAISRKLSARFSKTETSAIGIDSLLIYPHANPPYNAVKMLYVGREIAKDLDIRLSYLGKDGQPQTKQVTDFFPKEDPKMIWHYYKYDFLEPNQVAYFHLLGKKSVSDGKVTVTANFTGAISGKHICIDREFNLEL